MRFKDTSEDEEVNVAKRVFTKKAIKPRNSVEYTENQDNFSCVWVSADSDVLVSDGTWKCKRTEQESNYIKGR